MVVSRKATWSSLSAAIVVVVAAILASATIAVLTFCILWLLDAGSSDAPLAAFNIAFAVFFIGSFAAALGGVIFGVPLFGNFQRTGVCSWPPYALSGAVAALVTTLVVATALEIANAAGGQLWLFTLIWAIPIGALTGFFSWLIRRPDRDESSISAP